MKTRVEDLYPSHFEKDAEELLKKRKPSLQGEKPERFYRVIVDENDQNPIIGNVRTQTTYKSKLADEEFGSVLQFKVHRHCRRHS